MSRGGGRGRVREDGNEGEGWVGDQVLELDHK